MIKTFDIIISGFTQSRRYESGSELLWRRMRHLSTAEHCVQLREWRSDWKAVAAFVARNIDPVDGRVRIYAYSWGAGWGFRKLAAELKKHNIDVQVAVLCDPVFRSSLLPVWLPLNVMALLPNLQIKVPTNVHDVHWLYQRIDFPRGHQPRPTGGKTHVHCGTPLHTGHVHADSDPLYHKLAMEIANA